MINDQSQTRKRVADAKREDYYKDKFRSCTLNMRQTIIDAHAHACTRTRLSIPCFTNFSGINTLSD